MDISLRLRRYHSRLHLRPNHICHFCMPIIWSTYKIDYTYIINFTSFNFFSGQDRLAAPGPAATVQKDAISQGPQNISLEIANNCLFATEFLSQPHNGISSRNKNWIFFLFLLILSFLEQFCRHLFDFLNKNFWEPFLSKKSLNGISETSRRLQSWLFRSNEPSQMSFHFAQLSIDSYSEIRAVK